MSVCGDKKTNKRKICLPWMGSVGERNRSNIQCCSIKALRHQTGDHTAAVMVRDE